MTGKSIYFITKKRGCEMTTKLNKSVKRKSGAIVKDMGQYRNLIITLYSSDCIGIRPEKTRREEVININAVYQYAIRLRIQAEKQAKANARKAKKEMR